MVWKNRPRARGKQTCCRCLRSEYGNSRGCSLQFREHYGSQYEPGSAGCAPSLTPKSPLSARDHLGVQMPKAKVLESRNPILLLSILVTFLGLLVLSWPIVFSFDLWIFKDRGQFLNLDYLLDKQFR